MELVTFAADELRTYTQYDNNNATVLASASGTAILSDMSAQADGFTFTASVSNAYLGESLAVRINSLGVIDNLKFSWIPPPPAGTVLRIK